MVLKETAAREDGGAERGGDGREPLGEREEVGLARGEPPSWIGIEEVSLDLAVFLELPFPFGNSPLAETRLLLISIAASSNSLDR